MRSLPLSLAFFLLGAGTLALAIAIGQVATVALAWPALCALVLSVAYLGFPGLAFSKNPVDGRVALSSRVLMFPYRLVITAVLHLTRLFSRRPAHCELTPGIHIGRHLLPTEYPPGIRTLVDLTLELDEHHPPGTTHHYHNTPILDGAPLPPGALHELATTLAALPQPLYLHCAAGHGRTSMVAAALLMALGHAPTPSAALTMIAARRPRARPNRAQRRSVMALGA